MADVSALLVFINKDLDAHEVGYLQVKRGKQYEVFFEQFNEQKGNFKVRKNKKNVDLRNYLNEAELIEIQDKFNQKHWKNGVIYNEVILKNWK
ncbi:TPA: hypothetical protein PC496_000762 [Clostridioides difficile]|nr:hypothetical protein [Clostridioides difficile]